MNSCTKIKGLQVLTQSEVQAIHDHGFIVGGFVRNHLIGRLECTDIDVVLNFKLDDYQYNQFGVSQLVRENTTISFNLPRTETSFIGQTNQSVVSYKLSKLEIPLVDFYRRDITINSLYLDLATLEVIDPSGMGVDDLRAEKIRIIDPSSFYKDPSRIVRVIRYAKLLNFSIEPETLEALSRFLSRQFYVDKWLMRRLKLELNRTLSFLTSTELNNILSGLGKYGTQLLLPLNYN